MSTTPRQCPVSGHTGHLLQDIVDGPSASERLVTPVGVERELAEEGAVRSDDADVGAGDQPDSGGDPKLTYWVAFSAAAASIVSTGRVIQEHLHRSGGRDTSVVPTLVR